MSSKIFLNSFPKGGTNLAIKLLDLLGIRHTFNLSSMGFLGPKRYYWRLLRGPWNPSDFVLIGIDIPTPLRASWLDRKLKSIQPGSAFSGHIGYSDHIFEIFQSNELKCIQIIRDPRDIAVSHAHYVSSLPTHFLYRYYQSLTDWNERLRFSISGGPVPSVGYLESIHNRARSIEGWMRKAEVITIRFEDLVGIQGGGSEETQRASVIDLCEFLEINRSAKQISEVCQLIFGDSPTFRKGKIGNWGEEFTTEHIHLFNQVTNSLLSDWGYQNRQTYSSSTNKI